MSDNPQAAIWNSTAGQAWATHARHFDAMLEPFGEAVLDRLAVQSGQRVVDVGCGTGATTVRLAELAGAASVLGVDVSAPMLEMARARAAAGGVGNVEFVEADVGAAPFGHRSFDVAFSRFGVMFFADPVRAFGHIAASMVAGGRLGFVCFQAPPLNPFMVVPVMAAAAHLPMPPMPGPTDPGPFSLADPGHTTSILDAAGFTDVSVAPGPTSMVLGPADDLPGVARRVMEQNPGVGVAMAAATAAQIDAATEATIAALADHVADGVVVMPAATWVVTATAS